MIIQYSVGKRRGGEEFVQANQSPATAFSRLPQRSR